MNKEQQDRERFEAWAASEGLPLSLSYQSSFHYAAASTSASWNAWQARTPEIEALRAEVERLRSALRAVNYLATRNKIFCGTNGYKVNGINEHRANQIVDLIDNELAQADSIKADDAYTIGSNRYEIEPIGSKAKGE